MIYLAWSGGLNSTYALWEMLRRGLPVHAHHVRHTTTDLRFFTCAAGKADRAAGAAAGRARMEAEWDAIMAMRARLMLHAPEFEFTDSVADWTNSELWLDERHVVLMHLVNCAVRREYSPRDRLVIAGDAGEYAVSLPIYQLQALANEFAAAVGHKERRFEIFGHWLTPAQQFEALPGVLQDLVMSCRRPMMIHGRWTPCGSTRAYASPAKARWGDRKRPCNCARLVEFAPRYRNGWAANE